MKFIKTFFIITCLYINLNCVESINIKIDKVIFWGHKLHSNTFSYIHWGFQRAFEHLGYKTYWFDNKDNLDIDLSNSLFFTEGQVDEKIPLREDCFYVLHNCDLKKYKKIFDIGNALKLQVYTNDCIGRKLQKMHDYIFYNLDEKIIYMPWATDLLPHEIDKNKRDILSIKKENVIYWIGTIGKYIFGNEDQLNPFFKACKENNIEIKQFLTSKTTKENEELIKKSYMAPAIQGKWQCDVGYIPCRIFKNISYGQMGITNSETVYNLFNKKIIYNPDTYQLFYDAQNQIKNLQLEQLIDLMNFVRNNHTYINRINYIFKMINLIKQSE